MPADTVISGELRDEAREHIRDHARKEAARIERLSRGTPRDPGGGDRRGCRRLHRDGWRVVLASEAEEGLYAAEIADEGREIEEQPAREIAELALVLEDEGLPRDAAERVAHGLAANPAVFLRTKVQKELGLSPDVGGAALGDALPA
jgi:hypothetical protein